MVHPGEVKLRVAYNGLCGTDLHEIFDSQRAIPSQPHPLTGVTAPVVLGHEIGGTVVEVGAGVDRRGAGLARRSGAAADLRVLPVVPVRRPQPLRRSRLPRPVHRRRRSGRVHGGAAANGPCGPRGGERAGRRAGRATGGRLARRRPLRPEQRMHRRRARGWADRDRDLSHASPPGHPGLGGRAGPGAPRRRRTASGPR